MNFRVCFQILVFLNLFSFICLASVPGQAPLKETQSDKPLSKKPQEIGHGVITPVESGIRFQKSGFLINSEIIEINAPVKKVNESGTEIKLGVKLIEKPLEPVILEVTTKENDEIRISPQNLTFGLDNWDKFQNITVKGIADNIVDGDKQCEIQVKVVEGDYRFMGLTPQIISILNNDVDEAKIIQSTVEGSPTESGGAARFAIKLNSKPLSTVAVPIRSDNLSEAIVTPNSVVFNTNNWNKYQELVVEGQNDFRKDGDTAFNVLLGPINSLDRHYKNLIPSNIKLINYETEESTEGIKIPIKNDSLVNSFGYPNKSSGSPLTSQDQPLGPMKEITRNSKPEHLIIEPKELIVYESGSTKNVSLYFDSQITNPIKINIKTRPENEVGYSPKFFLFTPDNWDKKQALEIKSLDDKLSDGDREVQLEFYPDEIENQRFVKLLAPILKIKSLDNDAPGFKIGKHPTTISEDGGRTTIPIKLTSQPSSPLKIELSSDKSNEVKINPNTVYFTEKNWDTFQKIQVIGKDDFLKDGDTQVVIGIKKIETKDRSYQAAVFPEILLINKDTASVSNNLKSTKKISVGAATIDLGLTSSDQSNYDIKSKSSSLSKELTSLSEGVDYTIRAIKDHSDEYGKKAVYSVKLNNEPTDVVLIYAKSSNSNEGKVSPEIIKFDKNNWSVEQTIFAKGQDDRVKDGNVQYQIEFKAKSDLDLRYERLPPKYVEVINLDNDISAILTKQFGKVTSESGSKTKLAVKLSSKPEAPVQIPVLVSNGSEAKTDKHELTYTPDNWHLEQMVEIIGLDDQIDDGDQHYQVKLGPVKSSDINFNKLESKPLHFLNQNNDQAKLVLITTKKVTAESADPVKLGIKLTSKPILPVVVQLDSTDASEGKPYPSEVVFLPKNWTKTQLVEIQGQNDQINDGDIKYQIKLSTKKSDDRVYRLLPDQTVDYVNEDDDQAGILIGEAEGQPSESGEEAIVPINLKSEPVSTVTISIVCLNPKEAKVNSNQLIFTPQNWSIPQSIKISGVDDHVADGEQNVKVSISIKESMDPRYQILDPYTIDLVNRDDEVVGFSIDKPSFGTNEDGDQALFKISLKSKPLSPVKIEMFSNDTTEGVIDSQYVVFMPDNWSEKQAVTITGVNDQLIDGEQKYAIVLKPAISEDPKYNNLDPDDVWLSNFDNNLTNFVVSKVRGNTSEKGQNVSFVLRLNTKPKGKVQIKISSDKPTEAKPDRDSIWFNSSNWNQNQKITIVGYNDDYADGDTPYQINIASSSETDPVFNDIPPVILNLINKDDDKAGIAAKLINKMSDENGEEAQFSIRLTSKPTSSVVLLFSTSKPEEVQLVTAHAAFQENNWDKEQVIHIKGLKDDLVDGNQDYIISSKGAVSSDPKYNKLPFEPIHLVNKDVDEARFIVSEASGNTTESGRESTFTVRLSSRPRAKVSIKIKSENTAEGIIDKNKIEFNENNWNEDQIVTITGVDDYVKDEDKPYRIMFSSSVSDDKNFHGLSPRWVSLKNLDNKRVALGLSYIYGIPLGDFYEEFDELTGYAATFGYVYSGYVSFVSSYQILNLKGSPKKKLYNDTHLMAQTLDINNLSLGLKIIFMKYPVQLSTEPFLSLASWVYNSENQTDGTKQSDTGQDLGFGFNLGLEYPIYESFFLYSDLRYVYLTGGLGGRQMLFANLGFYFPF